MNYVIGDAIRKKIEEKGITFVSFAEKFGLTDRNLQYVFKKADLPISQIIRASEILDYDFLNDYTAHRKPKYKPAHNVSNSVEDGQGEYNSNNKKISINLTLTAEVNSYDEFPSLLKKIREDAFEFGFQIQ